MEREEGKFDMSVNSLKNTRGGRVFSGFRGEMFHECGGASKAGGQLKYFLDGEFDYVVKDKGKIYYDLKRLKERSDILSSKIREVECERVARNRVLLWLAELSGGTFYKRLRKLDSSRRGMVRDVIERRYKRYKEASCLGLYRSDLFARRFLALKGG